MMTAIYENFKSPETLLAHVDLEVVPRGIYEIGGVEYQYKGQPKFIMSKPLCIEGEKFSTLTMVELIVEKVRP
jgi:hypothetical protein